MGCRTCDAEGPYAKTEAEAIAAWNRRAEQDDGWQPIETAPKNAKVMFWTEWADDIGTVEWRKLHPHPLEPVFIGEHGTWSSILKATHWRPLPTPPKAP